MKHFSGLGLLFVILAPLPTLGQTSPLVTFSGGIGVNPVSNVTVSTATPPVTTATANTVRGIAPAGQFWVISGLDAAVSTTGTILVVGRGLLLGGGNSIGTNASQSVFATLFCGAATSATASSSSQTGVALGTNGDFVIEDTLTPVPANPCNTPVLLIRGTGTGQTWFAAGIPQ